MRFWVGWQQVALSLFATAVANGIVFTSYGVIAASLAREFHPSHTVLMLGIGGLLLSAALLSPIIGAWMDRYSLRLLIAGGAAWLGLGILALSFVQAMWQVVAIYIVFLTVPVTICGPMGASILLMRWFVQKRGLALGIAIAGISIGGFIFPPLIQHLIGLVEWREALRLIALGIFLTMVPAAFFLIVDRPSDRNLFPDGAATPPAVPLRTEENKAEPAPRVLTNPNFWFIALSLGIPASAGTGVSMNMVPFAGDLGIETTQAALVLSILATLSVAGKLSFAAIADRIDLRWIQACGVILHGLGLVVLAFADRPLLLFIGGGTIAYGSGLITPLMGPLIARVFGQERAGRIMGLAMLVALFLSMLAPVLIGAMRDLSGTYVTAFVFYAVLVGFATLLLLRIRILPTPAAAPAE
jgi:MFS family permease